MTCPRQNPPPAALAGGGLRVAADVAAHYPLTRGMGTGRRFGGHGGGRLIARRLLACGMARARPPGTSASGMHQVSGTGLQKVR
jgi:hypothetical protein